MFNLMRVAIIICCSFTLTYFYFKHIGINSNLLDKQHANSFQSNNGEFCRAIANTTSLKSVTEISDAKTLFYVHNTYWEVNALTNGHKSSKKLHNNLTVFNDIDAMAYSANEGLILFKNKFFYHVNSIERLSQVPRGKKIHTYFEQFPISGKVNAAIIIRNQKYDGFYHFDAIYLFKNDKLWQYSIYVSDGEVNTEFVRKFNFGNLFKTISGVIPRKVDSAYQHSNYIYLSSGKNQYRIIKKNFPDCLTCETIKISITLSDIIDCAEIRKHNANIETWYLNFGSKLFELNGITRDIVRLFVISLFSSGLICAFLCLIVFCKCCQLLMN